MASPDPASPDTFKLIRRRVLRALVDAFQQAAFALYYPDCDVTLQIRNGKLLRVDVRENEQVTT